MGIGGLMTTASYITGIILPFTCADRYNANLKTDLAFRLRGLNPILTLE